jgi:hypothetical protein
VNNILTKRKILILLFVLICSMDLSVFLLLQNTIKLGRLNNVAGELKHPSIIKSANDDTTAPIITIIIPNANNTSISTSFYEFIVEVTDANPPLPGEVFIEISNITTSLFNASMVLVQEDLWSFPWGNLTFYPNEETYIIRVRAKDSSSNENFGLSNEIYVTLNVSSESGPNPFFVIMYFLIVGGIFAFLTIYLNKKRGFVKTAKE